MSSSLPESTRPMRIVYCQWKDAISFGDEGWQDFRQAMKWAKEPLPIAHTAGILVYLDDHQVVIASSTGDDSPMEQVGQLMKIPREWVIKLVEATTFEEIDDPYELKES